MKKLLLLAIVVLGISAVSFGQTSATPNPAATASATVLQPLTIAETTQLNFGTIGNTGAISTVIIDAEDNRSGSAQLFTGIGGRQHKSAVFDIEGTKDNGFSITLPSGDTPLTRSGGSETMTIKAGDWKTNIGPYTEPQSATLDGNGKYTLSVGATLTVGAAQEAGDYSGTYIVTINYN